MTLFYPPSGKSCPAAGIPVGYGMGFDEILFPSGLGIVYELAYATTENVLAMWPLLTPLGSLFAQFEEGDLVVLLLIARRHTRNLALTKPVTRRGAEVELLLYGVCDRALAELPLLSFKSADASERGPGLSLLFL